MKLPRARDWHGSLQGTSSEVNVWLQGCCFHDHAELSSPARREPLLDEASYDWYAKFLIEESIPEYQKTLDAASDEGARGSMRWQIARDRMAYAVLLYSGGEDLEKVRAALPPLLNAIDEHLDHPGAVLESVDLASQTHYVEALWLQSLTTLLGLGDTQIQRVADSYAADETNDGADELFETLLAKLGRKSFPADGVIHDDPYQLLLDCIHAEPAERPSLMTKFLKRWFKGQKECDWWGSHVPRKGTTVLDTGFFGYWAFEAALVTHLWEIDDSSYRDLPHYPKDLIDYARAIGHRPTGPGGPTNESQRCEAGLNHCPHDGFWFTPAKAGSRRYFNSGEQMPDVGGTYGVTIWQWDANQGPPKL